MLKRTLTTAAIVVLALQALAGSAHAGRYHVYTCRTPAGEPAPVDGWVGSVAAGGAYDDYARNTCTEGGALIAALGQQTTHLSNVDRASWAFEAPAFAQTVGAALTRAGSTAGGATANATYQYWISAPSQGSIFDSCIATLKCASEGDVNQPQAASNRVTVPSIHLGSRLFANVSCAGPSEPEPYECSAGKGDPNGYAAAVYLFAADITLEQAAAPSVSAVHGELAETASVSGTSPLLFSAADPGSGVYAAVFSIDGTVVQRTLIDDNGGRCEDVGQSGDGLPAFLYLQPCKASVSADVGFDTAAIANGTHHLVVSVTDAAGNAAPVLDRTITVSNSSQPRRAGRRCGSRIARQRAPRRAQRRQRVRGREARGLVEGCERRAPHEQLRTCAHDRRASHRRGRRRDRGRAPGSLRHALLHRSRNARDDTRAHQRRRALHRAPAARRVLARDPFRLPSSPRRRERQRPAPR